MAKNVNPTAKNKTLRITWHIAQGGFASGWFLLLIIKVWVPCCAKNRRGQFK
tara:strand:- start:983 stop:1138 length:156 start_codon:yes stop_codon:yes gene_type:complete